MLDYNTNKTRIEFVTHLLQNMVKESKLLLLSIQNCLVKEIKEMATNTRAKKPTTFTKHNTEHAGHNSSSKHPSITTL